MIALTVMIIAAAAVATVHVIAQSRGSTVAELLTDALYAVAAVAYSSAVAMDSAIVEYRQVRRQIKAEHTPRYARGT